MSSTSLLLLLLLLFSLAAVRHSSADANHEVRMTASSNRNINGDKKLRDEIRWPWKGRKMVAENAEKREAVEVIKSSSSIEASSSSASISQHKEEGKLNLVQVLSNRSFSYRFKLAAGLIPFNSDYHPPKIHPPKNN